MQPLKFGPSYTSSDLGWDAQRTINLIPEIDETGEAKSGLNLRLVTAPGLLIRKMTGNNCLRGICTLPTGMIILVMQDTSLQKSAVYIYDQSANTYSMVPYTETYPAGPPALPGLHYQGWAVPNVYFEQRLIRFAYNGADLVIVDEGAELIKVTLRDSGSPGFMWTYMRDAGGALPFYPTDVTFTGGYFAFSEVSDFSLDAISSAKFYLSGLYDTTLDPLDVATAEYKADGLCAVGSISNALWLFGYRTLEVWSNTGGVDFPFERINGASSDTGMLSRASLQQLSDAFIWLACTIGGRPFIAMTQGYTPSRISTQPIDAQLAEVGPDALTTATSFVYSYAGHYYYGLNVPALSTTFVYDLSTKMWHERTCLSYVTNAQHSVGYTHSSPGLTSEQFVFRNGEPGILELDFLGSTLLHTITHQEGSEMVCERSFPIVSHASGNRVQHNKVQLDSSAGSVATQPAFTLQWSDNSGKDFVDGRTLQPADVGEYNERFIWRRLGTSRSRLYKLNFSTTQPVSLRSVMLDSEVLGG